MIKVNYELYTTAYLALKRLRTLPKLLSLDFETQSIYTKAERDEAKEFLKGDLDRPTNRLCKLVSNSSGLSFPAITKITHVNIAWSKDEALVIVINDKSTEQAVLKWIVNTDRHFIFWNAGFDVKQIFVKTGKFPKSYDDGQLLAKCYLNHVDVFKAEVGLKELMGQYYDAKWTMINGYDNEDLKDEAFLYYSAIDACATYHGWEILQEMENETTSTTTD